MAILNKHKPLLLTLFLCALFIMSFNITSYANSAYSGYMNVYVRNAPDGYLLDILIKGQVPGSDNSEDNNPIQDSPLYKYEKDGWYPSARVKHYFYPQDTQLIGEYDWKTGLKVHSFGHRGLPEYVKIAIQLPDGALRVSEEIKIESVSNDLLFDAKTAEVETAKNPTILFLGHKTSALVKAIAISLLLTLLVEGAWVLTFLGKKGFWFLPVNIITQALMHTVLIFMFYKGMRPYMPGFTYGFEIVLPFIEAFMYKALLKDSFSMKRLLIMSILANISSFYIGIAIGI